MEIPFILFALFIVYLIVESIEYPKKLKKIPLRISVSGTRGKTSIVRTLASVLREDGKNILAKTTGSEAMYILPNGEEERITRRGMTSILEQKKLIRKAVKLKVDCVITEIMSIHPENHFVETHKLLKPNIIVFSNFRTDHTDVAGNSVESVTKLLLNDLYPESKVFVHENEINEVLNSGIEKNNCNFFKIPFNKNSKEIVENRANFNHVVTNLDLVFGVCKHLKINENVIVKGIKNTSHDVGNLEIFKFISENKAVYFVNSFAANDPESSMHLIDKVKDVLKLSDPFISALINLRGDRGERSKQWLRFLKNSETDFAKLYVSGIHSGIFKRKIQNAEALKGKNAHHLTKYLISQSDHNTIIFGLANIKGFGESLVEYWKSTGEIYKLKTNTK